MKAPTLLRSERRRRARPAPGTAPGTLSTAPDAPPPQVEVLAYGPHEITEFVPEDLGVLREMRGKWPVLWVNVEGLGGVQTVAGLGEIFGLHRLALEDVVNVTQRPKVEEYDHYLFVVARMAQLRPELDTEQISLFLGSGFLLTFQERHGDPFDPVRERIRTSHGRIRGAGADYLGYAVLDAIVDHFFPVLEHYGDKLEGLELEVLEGPTRDTINRLHLVKRDLMGVRRAVWPQREALNTLVRDATPLIHDETRIYLRDAYDHLIQIIELTESYRDLASSLTDLYLSSVSNRMNEIMKVLTMFAAIFIPLSFIAGLYGMNFDREVSPLNMPELGWYFGYPFALLLMAVVAGGLVVYFRRKGWLGGEG
jgi:magnesium transporter